MVRFFAPRSEDHRRGGVLLEFAIVALVFYVLFAAIVDMGRASFMAATANDAARVMARELALAPLAANLTFEEALSDPIVRGSPADGYHGIYDAQYLVVDLDNDLAPGQSLDQYFGDKPIVNRALRPLMIFDRVEVDGGERRFYRYPGALVRLDNSGGGASEKFIVVIPEVQYSSGGESIVRWLPVIQEIRQADPGPVASASSSPFSALSSEGGIAAIRVNVPFQSSTTGGRSIDSSDPEALFESGFGSAVLASSSINVANNLGAIAPAGTLVVGSGSATNSGAYAGDYGLGSLTILGERTRPFRKILAGQSIFRREVFGQLSY